LINPSDTPTRLTDPRTRFATLAKLGQRLSAAPAADRRISRFIYEFVGFGLKQAWACLFGGIMVGMMIATRYGYPEQFPLQRYDFLFLGALVVQIILLGSRLETFEEAKVILFYHVVGTIMEIFKTSVGSWIYPEPSMFRIGGVPLFTGFMYSCIGSYLCRVWRVFDFRFVNHPPQWALIGLSTAIYINFFSHHYLPDIRIGLFIATIILFARSRIYFKIRRVYRTMPLLLGFSLVAFFIWLSENIGTLTRTWIYPSQMHGWSPVSIGKLGSWFLLLIISYTMVALINKPKDIHESDKITEASAGHMPA
jgi:uncharacterized membrane protein YoaT (DUF817 family)